MSTTPIWAIVGASRGIGHEFVSQLLKRGDQVVATVRTPSPQYDQWEEQNGSRVFQCDMLSEESIDNFASQLRNSSIQRLDYLVLNAGILQYPNRATELSYTSLLSHLQTNTVGPIITAQRLLQLSIPIGTIVFISSDSGSAQNFLAHEDGFAAYAASKAALNQLLRHMAAELERKCSTTTVIALHPGEVATDMANVQLGWDVQNQMTPKDSVEKCIRTIESKTLADSGTFWTWENERYPW